MTISEEVLSALSLAFWISFGVAAILAYPIWRLLLLTKSRQTVSQYAPEGHQAKQGTPTMGGLIVVAGYLVTLLTMTFLPLGEGLGYINRSTTSFLILAFGFTIIGFVDDFVVPRLLAGKRGLGWKQKILMQLVVAILGVGLSFGWQNFSAMGIGVFLVLFFSNAYNFSDGLDGLAGSLLLGLCLGLIGISLCVGYMEPVAAMLVPLVGAVIPFLFLNAPPAKVFMGDVGSLPIGAVLGMAVACLSLPPSWVPTEQASYVPEPGVNVVFDLAYIAPWIPLVVLSLVMVAELVPVPLQILSVKLRKKKLFPYTPIHHAFEKAGWPETRVVSMFSLIQLLLSILALTLTIHMSAAANGAA